MSQDIVLPALGESVSEATVTRWLKCIGDTVEVGEALVEVATDKVDSEVVSTAAGVVGSLLVAVDETVDIGTVLATVIDESEAPPMPPPVSHRSAHLFRSPRVRALTSLHGIDADHIAGTGLDGRVTRADVLAAVGARAATASTTTTSPGRDNPRAQVSSVIEIDVSRIDPRDHLPALADAVVKALRAYPTLVSGTNTADVVLFTEKAPDGILMRNAGSLGFADWAAAIDTPPLPAGSDGAGAFSILETGHRGTLFESPVLAPAAVAALGIGSVTRRPVVIDRDGEDQIAMRSIVYVALSYDPSAVESRDAAGCLRAVKARLESGGAALPNRT